MLKFIEEIRKRRRENYQNSCNFMLPNQYYRNEQMVNQMIPPQINQMHGEGMGQVPVQMYNQYQNQMLNQQFSQPEYSQSGQMKISPYNNQFQPSPYLGVNGWNQMSNGMPEQMYEGMAGQFQEPVNVQSVTQPNNIQPYSQPYPNNNVPNNNNMNPTFQYPQQEPNELMPYSEQNQLIQQNAEAGVPPQNFNLNPLFPPFPMGADEWTQVNTQGRPPHGLLPANPYPSSAKLTKQQKAQQTSSVSNLLTHFKTQDGSLDYSKMVNTAGSMVNTVNQISGIVKSVGAFLPFGK